MADESTTREQQAERQVVQQERWQLLHNINTFTELPLIGLSFVWLVLLIVDFTGGLNPWLQALSNVIWLLFGLDFLLKFTVAPYKLIFLRRNWLTVVALALPAFRLLRAIRALSLLRAARAARTISLLRVLTTVNRGMGATRSLLAQHGIGYVIALTLVMLFAGAAGMAYFESPAALHSQRLPGAGLSDYADALWWTAMLISTMGSSYWPQTVEGRILTLLLSLYGLAILSYITATIASYFIGQRQVGPSPPLNEPSADSQLRGELALLRRQLDRLSNQLEGNAVGADGRAASAKPDPLLPR